MRPGWWTALLVASVCLFIFVCAAQFAGVFRSVVPITVTSDRAGLVMESGAKVKLRGVQVGRVAGVTNNGDGPVALKLDIDSDRVKFIPANVDAEIRASTAFGAKYVDLVVPADPSAQHVTSGAVIRSLNVTTEVNTVFQNVVDILHQVQPDRINAVLTALADGTRGQGKNLGAAITGGAHVVTDLNARMSVLQQDWRSVTNAVDAYEPAASHILEILDNATVTSTTVTAHAAQLDALLLNATGLAHSGTELLATNGNPLVQTLGMLNPTTDLLLKYNPEYTCLLLGSQWILDHGARDTGGGNGYSGVLDFGITLGKDPYSYPNNLPIVAAKGGPGGKPGCGSLPDPMKAFPGRYLVTNTGWGTGLDQRPNPGIGHPCWANYLPVTRADPQPASIRQCLPGPAIGPVPYPGAPAYGAPRGAAAANPPPPPPGLDQPLPPPSTSDQPPKGQ